MKVTHLHTGNFKPLVDFDLSMASFTCLVGLIAQQFKGDVEGWLESRQWKAADLNSRLTKKSNISLSVDLEYEGEKGRWW